MPALMTQELVAPHRGTPDLLSRLHATALAAIPPELLGPDRTWVHLGDVRAIWESFAADVPGTGIAKKHWRQSVRKAQFFLAPLAEQDCCRVVRRGSLWSNPRYTPPAPFGEYLWVWTVRTVQDLLWMRPEFVDGFRSGCDPRGRDRDRNPHEDRSEPHMSWDSGWKIGHTHYYHPERLQQWLDAHL